MAHSAAELMEDCGSSDEFPTGTLVTGFVGPGFQNIVNVVVRLETPKSFEAPCDDLFVLRAVEFVGEEMLS